MPTPSDPLPFSASPMPPPAQRRSIFPNYEPTHSTTPAPPAFVPTSTAALPIETAIDPAVARAFIYRFLARGFEYPDPTGWAWLANPQTTSAFESAVRTLAPDPGSLLRKQTLPTYLQPNAFESFARNYLAAFGHAARGPCPSNEIEYGELNADALSQPHRLADLAAFYRAFGLELAPDGAERHDHIAIELEFMSVLAAKEAYALQRRLDPEPLTVCRAAQQRFLREHLGRWATAFARRLARMVGEQSPLGALGNFTGDFVLEECARFMVAPGSQDLRLRPPEEAFEAACGPCASSNPHYSL